MIISAFPFFDEIELLKLRIHELRGLVSKFVLVESTRTFQGREKPLWGSLARENGQIPKDWPVEIVTVDLPEHAESPWDRERVTKEAVIDAACAACTSPNDILIIGDADEVPRASALTPAVIGLVGVEIRRLDMRMYYYYLDNWVTIPWACCFAGPMRLIREDRWRARGNELYPVISRAGWHWSYLGGAQAIWRKVNAYSHTETVEHNPDLSEAAIAERLALGRDPFKREDFTCWRESLGNLPEYVRDNRHRLRDEGFFREKYPGSSRE